MHNSAESNTDPATSSPSSIDRFTGRWEFLSNYFPAVVIMDDMEYSTVEHAYQAAKISDPAVRLRIAEASDPDEAKLLGRALLDRADWEETKVAVMRGLVEQKFRQPDLRTLLLSTGTAELVEGNEWGDDFWGVSSGHGENYMGLILMAVREQARRGGTARHESPRVTEIKRIMQNPAGICNWELAPANIET